MMHLKVVFLGTVARRSGVCVLFLAAYLGIINESRAVTPSTPMVQSNIVSFSFDSVPDQLFTVQNSESLSRQWFDAAYHRGTGMPIIFSAPATNVWRFFRVRSTPFEPLALFPGGPTLPSGDVSLPDAVAG